MRFEVFEGDFKKKLDEWYDWDICWAGDRGSMAPKLRSDYFSVRWTGWLKAPRPGRYRLISYADDSIRVWLRASNKTFVRAAWAAWHDAACSTSRRTRWPSRWSRMNYGRRSNRCCPRRRRPTPRGAARACRTGTV
ncbi:MAG: hypothetical protein IAF94_19405 [Pirellulaceae bacterium]|nr:hypothetical protein [Pirellulaceae bacterium]